MPEKDQDKTQLSKYDIELPQGIIESFARFLVSEIQTFYESEEGKITFEEWENRQNQDKEHA